MPPASLAERDGVVGYGARDQTTGAVCRPDAMGGDPGAGAASCKAGAARYLGRYPGGVGAARDAAAARAAGEHRRNRGDGLRTRLGGGRAAHRGIAERHRRARDRAVRGAALRFGPGGDAGAAGSVGGGRARPQQRARDGCRLRPRLRCRRTHLRRVHAAATGAPERAGVVAGGCRGRGSAARNSTLPGSASPCASPRS